MASISAYELDATVRKVKGTGMVNKLLQLICVGEGLPKYGVKADLQQKIIDSEFHSRGVIGSLVLPLPSSSVPAINQFTVRSYALQQENSGPY
jgi:hypothetical protein